MTTSSRWQYEPFLLERLRYMYERLQRVEVVM
jgi:hypothetical protein